MNRGSLKRFYVSVGFLLFGAGLFCGWFIRGSGLATKLGTTVGLIAPIVPIPTKGPESSDVWVILSMGQSNAANFGQPRSRAGHGVYAFTKDGFFACVDPIPGANGHGGSVWPRWTELRRKRKPGQEIVIVCLAQGSSRVTDWVPGGLHFFRIQETVNAMQAHHLKINCVLWHQGETEAWQTGVSANDYEANLRKVIGGLRSLQVTAPIIVCQTSRDGLGIVNESIRSAQAAVWSPQENIWPGPDTDKLGDEYRSDGVHFNGRGLERFAQELDEAIKLLELKEQA